MTIPNESTAQHTPKPWTLGTAGKIIGNGIDGQSLVAQTWGYHECPPEFRFNAYLIIIAAPDLLAELDTSANLLCGFICRHRLGDPVKHADQCIANYVAIAKARGDSTA